MLASAIPILELHVQDAIFSCFCVHCIVYQCCGKRSRRPSHPPHGDPRPGRAAHGRGDAARPGARPVGLGALPGGPRAGAHRLPRAARPDAGRAGPAHPGLHGPAPAAVPHLPAHGRGGGRAQPGARGHRHADRAAGRLAHLPGAVRGRGAGPRGRGRVQGAAGLPALAAPGVGLPARAHGARHLRGHGLQHAHHALRALRAGGAAAPAARGAAHEGPLPRLARGPQALRLGPPRGGPLRAGGRGAGGGHAPALQPGRGAGRAAGLGGARGVPRAGGPRAAARGRPAGGLARGRARAGRGRGGLPPGRARLTEPNLPRPPPSLLLLSFFLGRRLLLVVRSCAQRQPRLGVSKVAAGGPTCWSLLVLLALLFSPTLTALGWLLYVFDRSNKECATQGDRPPLSPGNDLKECHRPR
mmetsp:Transcript_23091/g.36486  ORF Transcript_23091/g.36486 Transcript_23091/m.36486 type:complete len:414 (+) Transcript_23091:496-1737(+)